MKENQLGEQLSEGELPHQHPMPGAVNCPFCEELAIALFDGLWSFERNENYLPKRYNNCPAWKCIRCSSIFIVPNPESIPFSSRLPTK